MKISVVNTPKRNEVKINRQRGIFNNGEDNAYPQLIERLINGSVTAKTASNMLKKFLIGDGFAQSGLNEKVIYSDFMGEVTMYGLLSQVAGDIAKHRGAFVQIQWNANGTISQVKHIPYRDCRLGKSDSNNYSGKIHVYNNWDRQTAERFDTNKIKVVDVWNPIAEVIQEQLKSDNWNGQIAYLFLDDEYIYPLATIDCVRLDADSENEASMYRNSELRRGFFAKYLVYHTAFDDQKDEVDFREVLESTIGGDKDSSLVLIPAIFGEDGKPIAETNIKLEKVEQTANADAFKVSEEMCGNNIRKAHNAIPKILIDSNDSSLFGNSGEAFVQAFNFYNTQTKDTRTGISQWFAKIMKHAEDDELRNANYDIKPLSFEQPQTQQI